jgi:nucleotide-binding universal stress UspA family protein
MCSANHSEASQSGRAQEKRRDGRAGDGPLLLCYDGSEGAEYAIDSAGSLLVSRRALVVNVWEPSALLGSFAWTGASTGGINFVELDRAAAENGGEVAGEGVRIARAAGMEAEPLAIKATGPVWKTIVEIADDHHAAAIVIGSRGLSAVNRMLLGSVSTAVLHHADRPTLVIHRPSDNDAD